MVLLKHHIYDNQFCYSTFLKGNIYKYSYSVVSVNFPILSNELFVQVWGQDLLRASVPTSVQMNFVHSKTSGYTPLSLFATHYPLHEQHLPPFGRVQHRAMLFASLSTGLYELVSTWPAVPVHMTVGPLFGPCPPSRCPQKQFIWMPGPLRVPWHTFRYCRFLHHMFSTAIVYAKLCSGWPHVNVRQSRLKFSAAAATEFLKLSNNVTYGFKNCIF